MNTGFENAQRPLNKLADDARSMPYRYRWLLFALGGLIIIFFAFVFILAPKADVTRARPAQVAATIFPIYDITRNIAGDAVDVELVLPPSASPHTYEPTPSELVRLQNVKLYFAIGHGLDDWASELFGLRVDKYVVDEGIAIISKEDEHREGSDLGDAKEKPSRNGIGTDPHYWLSIPNAKVIARNIHDQLVRKFPSRERVFERNLSRYLKDLDIAENAMRDGFSDVQNRNIITLHDSWYYFAIAYGFNVVGTFEPTAGREPTARYLADLSKKVESIGAEVLYSEPQIATQGIEPFARDAGLRIVELDPLGGTDGRDSFIRLMKYNAKVIRQHQE